jgi:hypothetical protein
MSRSISMASERTHTMPVRLPPITDAASRVLLEGVIDYAGLFPPAGVAMSTAVRNYAHYRASGDGWMLGRFVCPVAGLEEFSRVADPFLPRDAGAIPWRLTVTGSGNVDADRAAIAAFNTRHRVCFDECGAIVDAYETRVENAGQVAAVSSAIGDDMQVYIEVPLESERESMLSAISHAGRRAKMRTGGVTAGAFPAPGDVVSFLARCIELEITAKATAGLHHALRGSHPLTYEQDAPCATMFGFVNVFLAAALLTAGATETDAVAMLQESDWSNIEVNDLQFGWRGPETVHVLDRILLAQVRSNVLVSFGSCSFAEPVAESRELGLL